MALKGIKRISPDDPIRQPRACKICGDFFTPPKPSRQRKGLYCSLVCRQKGISVATAVRRGNILRGRGEGKTYTKLNGQHAHRIMAEILLGRPLQKGEIVHHKNGNIKDNSLSNLEVMTQSQHAKLHWAERKEAINA